MMEAPGIFLGFFEKLNGNVEIRGVPRGPNFVQKYHDFKEEDIGWITIRIPREF